MSRTAVVAAITAIAACGDTAPPSVGASEPGAPPSPAIRAAAKPTVSTAVAATTGPLGALAPAPPSPTPARVGQRSCAAAAPIELGASDRVGVAVEFGPTSGIAAWSISDTRIAIRAIDRAGVPIGAAHEVDVPARVNDSYGIRALDGHYLVFLSATDYAGPSPILELYALVTDPDGKPTGSVLQLAIGDRGTVDSVSPAAAHGVWVWAGPTPATHVATGRLIALVVDDRGALAQSVVDVPDPSPGNRSRGFYSFGAHAVAVLGSAYVIVDGERKPQTRNADPDGIELAPTFTGATVPVLGFMLGKDAKTIRYGTLALDGAIAFGKEVPKSAPLRAPFEERVSWGVSTGDGTTSVFAVIEPTFATFGSALAVPPAVANGIRTQIVWSGDQILAAASVGGAVRIAPLPCR